MTLGGFLAPRTAGEVLEQRVATERLEIQSEPDEERSELREIYRAKGLRSVKGSEMVSLPAIRGESGFRPLQAQVAPPSVLHR